MPGLFADPFSLFAACAVSGLLVPLPEDVALLLAGWQIEEGQLGAVEAAVAGITGTFVRDAVAFGAGRLVAHRASAGGWLSRLSASARITAWRDRLEARGDALLFATRFLVGIRAALYFAGGTTRVPFARFALYDAVGLLITTPLLLALGAWLGPGAAAWLEEALHHQRALLAGAALVAVAWVAWATWARRARRAADQPPVA